MTITGSDPPIQPLDACDDTVRSEADDIVSLYLRGEFDAFNASEITDHALRALAADKHLVLDLSDTTFIDASVIGALVAIQAAADDRGRSAVLSSVPLPSSSAWSRSRGSRTSCRAPRHARTDRQDRELTAA